MWSCRSKSKFRKKIKNKIVEITKSESFKNVISWNWENVNVNESRKSNFCCHNYIWILECCRECAIAKCINDNFWIKFMNQKRFIFAYQAQKIYLCQQLWHKIVFLSLNCCIQDISIVNIDFLELNISNFFELRYNIVKCRNILINILKVFNY